MQSGRAEPLYDTVGTGYDTTRRADPYLTGRLAHHLALSGSRAYLDLACGTGNYTTALAALGGEWFGVDQSRRMLESARQKEGPVKWVQADASALPFPNGVFFGVIATCAIHHFPSIRDVFSEVFRVLASGSFIIFTDTHQQMRGYWLNEYFPDAMGKSIVQMPDLDEVQSALQDAGFQVACTETYDVQPDLQDFFLYSGKHRPEIYLSESVRRGITTFALLADPTEVETGVQRLSADIQSGHIAQVMANYRNDGGDYLFVVAEKSG